MKSAPVTQPLAEFCLHTYCVIRMMTMRTGNAPIECFSAIRTVLLYAKFIIWQVPHYSILVNRRKKNNCFLLLVILTRQSSKLLALKEPKIILLSNVRMAFSLTAFSLLCTERVSNQTCQKFLRGWGVVENLESIPQPCVMILKLSGSSSERSM